MLEITEFAHFEPGDMASLIAMIPSTGISGFNLKGIPLTNTDVEEVLAASILKSVHMKSPRLTSLAIEGCQTSTIFDVIQNIETLSSVSLDFRIIVLVSRPRTSAKLHRREYKLSNLVNLHLIGDTSSIAIMLQLGFPATPQLKNLRISLAPSIPRELEGRGDLLLLVDEITERAFFLDSLVIENDLDPGNPCLGLPLASLDYFSRPSCKKLKALTLSSLDDMSSVSFSRLFATPHRSLVSLDIRSGHRNASDNVDVLGFEVSLGGLQTICRMAPNLKRLHMPICHGLEELVLKPYAYDNQYPSFRRPSQKLANLLGIARHIDYLFPHLKKIDTQEIRPFVDENWLDGLEAAIKQFADIRKMAKGDCDVCRRDSEK